VVIRCAEHVTPLYQQNLSLPLPTGSRLTIGIVCLQTKSRRVLYVMEARCNDVLANCHSCYPDRLRTAELIFMKFCSLEFYLDCQDNKHSH
jgi:hypothetical protein